MIGPWYGRDTFKLLLGAQVCLTLGLKRLHKGIAFELGPIKDKNSECGEVKKGRVF